jgi:ubiquinone/menaquinone biosynthesis C-methylase UbiE
MDNKRMDILINKIYKILTNNDKKVIKGIINENSSEILKLSKISKIITSITIKYKMKPDLHRQDFIANKIKLFLNANNMISSDFNIIDVGGGNGNVLSMLKNVIDKNATLNNSKFVCLETLSDWCESYEYNNKNIEYKFWKNDDIDLPANSFDAALCMVSLHHMSDETILNVLQSLKRILKPNGKILIKEHNNKNLDTFRYILWEHHLYHLLDCAYNSKTIDMQNYYETNIYNFKSKDDWHLIFHNCGYKCVGVYNRFLDGEYIEDNNNVSELYWAVYENM